MKFRFCESKSQTFTSFPIPKLESMLQLSHYNTSSVSDFCKRYYLHFNTQKKFISIRIK